ncbi:MAG: DUF4836 family protein [Muribaculaceae bacterium]|nr:DUF4836 family protein [Muribaculaceae bacterium]
MRRLKVIFYNVLLVMCAVSCINKSEPLSHYIPADAGGVVCVNVPAILADCGILSDEKVVIPESLQSIIASNDNQILCKVLNDLPQLGIDVTERAYLYVPTGKSFEWVLLVRLADEKLTKKVIEMRTGCVATDVDDADVMTDGDVIYVIKHDDLLVARSGNPAGAESVKKAAVKLLSDPQNPIDKEALAAIETPNHIEMVLRGDAVSLLVSHISFLQPLIDDMPLIAMLLDSDIDQIKMWFNLGASQCTMNVEIGAAEGSDYRTMITSMLQSPSSEVLYASPSTMTRIYSASIKGAEVLKFEQVEQLLSKINEMPHLEKLDVKSILSLVDGPLTVATSPSTVIDDEYNIVIALKTSLPDEILDIITDFAMHYGQAPVMKNGEYLYEYGTKAIRLGLTDGVVYMKILDYQQTEGNANEFEDIKHRFDSSSLCYYSSEKISDKEGYFSFGINQSGTKGEGLYYVSDPDANAGLSLLEAVCMIKPAERYDSYSTREINEVKRKLKRVN